MYNIRECTMQNKRGEKCAAPALSGYDWCIAHQPGRVTGAQSGDGEAYIFETLKRPFQSLADVSALIAEITEATALGKINHAQCGAMLKCAAEFRNTLEVKAKIDPNEVSKRTFSAAAAWKAADRISIKDARRLLISKFGDGMEALFGHMDVVEGEVVDDDANTAVQPGMLRLSGEIGGVAAPVVEFE